MFITVKRASEIAMVSEETVRRWIRNGELEAVKEGKRYVIDRESLQNFIEKKKNQRGNSISKMALILNEMEGKSESIKTFSSFTGFGTAVVLENDNRKDSLTTFVEEPGKLSIDNIKNLINYREVDRRMLELDYERKILQIEREILKLKELLQQIENPE
ncbi:hypothetical protein ABE67_14050 [Cytobacillus firmus]|uniref:helix-turn-helix domain-containing protein n=1 Tax=Cytobacillus firmus TaxID=1399 RepID=UPI0018CD9927|nr:helix-turn-helix domain-containing protein [Cytobacillus firmus]MBG9450418.1 hypothetical protein [Cytobacillus firmus]